MNGSLYICEFISIYVYMNLFFLVYTLFPRIATCLCRNDTRLVRYAMYEILAR